MAFFGMRSHVRRWLVPALLLVAAGCGILVTEPMPYGTIRTEVRTRGGAPIKDVVVELYIGAYSLQYGRTDDSGRVVFRRVPVGQYGVTPRVSMSEFADLAEFLPEPSRTYVDGIDVVAGLDTTIAFTFARRGVGAIETSVRAQTGRPLPGMTVYFYGQDGVFAQVVTDNSGRARLDSVPLGQYGAFTIPPDSLGVPGQGPLFRDALGVDAEIVPRAEFTIQTCVGTIAAQTRDQDERPIVDAPVVLYSGAGILTSVRTSAAGVATFTNLRCDNYGVFMLPDLPGYEVRFEPGFAVVDGLLITPDTLLAPTLRAYRNP